MINSNNAKSFIIYLLSFNLLNTIKPKMSVQQLQSIEMYEVNDGEENVDCLLSDSLKPHFDS